MGTVADSANSKEANQVTEYFVKDDDMKNNRGSGYSDRLFTQQTDLTFSATFGGSQKCL